MLVQRNTARRVLILKAQLDLFSEHNSDNRYNLKVEKPVYR
jgi:hypothetical protein